MLNSIIIPESFLRTQMFHSVGVCISDLVAHLVLPNDRCKRLTLQNPSSHHSWFLNHSSPGDKP